MTFDTLESSVESSRPVEVFLFTLGAESFAYTSSEDEVAIGAQVYEPVAILRGRITQNPEDRDSLVEITVDGNNEFARRYIGVVPGSRAKLVIYRVQRADFPGPTGITLFQGYVSSVRFEEDGYIAKIAVQSTSAALSRTIPRFTYQGLCSNVLYDSACKVDDTDAAFRVVDTVTAISENTITVPATGAFSSGYFTGGFVEGLGGQDARLILEHTGSDLLLLLPFPFDILGNSVTVLAGCDHTLDTCHTKFFTPEDTGSNVINYGGFGFIPSKDIFANGL